MTGLDAGLLVARRKGAQRAVVDGRTVVVRDDLSGRIVAVDPTLPRLLLAAAIVAVVSPPAVGEDGRPLNVDADRAASALAAALGAAGLVLLTGVPGVLGDGDVPMARLERAWDRVPISAGTGVGLLVVPDRLTATAPDGAAGAVERQQRH